MSAARSSTSYICWIHSSARFASRVRCVDRASWNFRRACAPAGHLHDLAAGAQEDPVVASRRHRGLEETLVAGEERRRTVIAGLAHREVVDAIWVLGIADVGPESTLGTAGLRLPRARAHGCRRSTTPGTAKPASSASAASGSSRSAAFLTQSHKGAPRQMHAVSDQDIFEPVEREVVGELADQHEGDQLPGRRFPALHEFGRNRWAGHAVRGTSSKRTWAGRGRSLRVWPG